MAKLKNCRKIRMCFKKNNSRVQLKKLIRFLNKNRIWICSDNCAYGPECSFCTLIYQINYSYKNNKNADVTVFRNSIFGPSFSMLEDMYNKHEGKKKWLNFDKCFTKKQKNIYTFSFL